MMIRRCFSEDYDIQCPKCKQKYYVIIPDKIDTTEKDTEFCDNCNTLLEIKLIIKFEVEVSKENESFNID